MAQPFARAAIPSRDAEHVTIILEEYKGVVSLIDLFHGRRQLIAYCAMLEPGAEPCRGCSLVMDNIGHNLAHVNARNTTFVFTSPALQSEIIALQKRMGWDAPWYTDHGRRFADAFGAGTGFAINAFIRDDENRVCRTYFTTNRGGELFDTNFRLLDLTAYGRQEMWEDSPPVGRRHRRMNGGACTTNTARSRA